MKNNTRVKLSRKQYFNHFSSVGIFLLVPFFLMQELFSEYGYYRTVFDIIQIPLMLTIPAILKFVIQLRKLRFREIKVIINDNELTDSINRTIQHLGWIIKVQDKDLIRAYRPSKKNGSLNEMITIRRINNGLLFNSINSPDDMISVLSLGKNKLNKKIFIQNLSDVKKKISEKSETIKVDNELSTKRNLFRFFMYPLCLLLIAGIVFVIFDSKEPELLIGGIFIIILVSFWMYSDVRIVFKKISERNI